MKFTDLLSSSFLLSTAARVLVSHNLSVVTHGVSLSVHTQQFPAYPEQLFNMELGEDGMLEDQRKDGKIKNTLSFKGIGHKT
jgi:hypothetical protein